MPNAVIVDAIRTPLGKRNGKLKDVHPVDLVADVLRELVSRNGVDPALVEDVIMGCVMQVGEQGINVGRNAALAAGFPESTVGTTIDRQCGSSQQAAHFAAQGVIAGAYDVVVAAGVEVMTRVPMGSAMADGKFGFPFGPKVGARSQASARRATDEGRFQAEILPVLGADGQMVTIDEGLRDTTMESLGALKPSFKSAAEGGRVTAGNSSQITDGASAILIMSEEKA